MLETGTKAPDFNLQGIDGSGNEQTFSLKGLLSYNKNLVIYFYPKDSTPGCTTQACDFRDNFNRLNAQALVVGISADSIASHKKFQEKQGLNFILLSDPEKQIIQAYGSWGEKNMYGKKTMGIVRSTFIVGKDGAVKRVWSKVKVAGHVDEVILELEKL